MITERVRGNHEDEIRQSTALRRDMNHCIPVVKTHGEMRRLPAGTLWAILDTDTEKGVERVLFKISADRHFVAATAKLGANVYIGCDTIISDSAIIGDDVHIGSGVFIGPEVQLSNKCTVQSRAIVGNGSRIGLSACIGKGAIVRVNQRVPGGKNIPENSLV